MLGTGKATEVSKEATTTLDGAGDREALGKRTDLLRSTTCTTTPDYEGEKLQAAAGLRVCCARAAAGGESSIRKRRSERAPHHAKGTRYVSELFGRPVASISCHFIVR